ncbi:MAG: alpha/beta hydrolase [Anaerolineae bacterium]|nr:alpha/beta hydrolase [Anaerolineae bacterium]
MVEKSRMSETGTDKRIQLRSGRHLGYAEYGDPGGKPVFLFHGLPGSRHFHHPDDSIAMNLGLRLIAIDRPGFGLSDSQPTRRLLQWPDDVAEFADNLGIDRFAVLGVAAGGAYALSCAYKIPRRLTTVAIASSISPMNRRGLKTDMIPMLRNSFQMGYRAPWLLRLVMWFGVREAIDDPETYLSRLDTSALCESDRAIFHEEAFRKMWLTSILDTFRQGSGAFIDDVMALSRPWRFKCRDIAIPVFLWHGEQDRIAPSKMGHYLDEMIPACTATFYPDEGHAVFFNHWQEILTTIASEFVRLHD